jgi:hypothetical protein
MCVGGWGRQVFELRCWHPGKTSPTAPQHSREAERELAGCKNQEYEVAPLSLSLFAVLFLSVSLTHTYYVMGITTYSQNQLTL